MDSDPAPKNAFTNFNNQQSDRDQIATVEEESKHSDNVSFKSDDDFGLSQSNLSMSTVQQPRFG